MEFSKKLEIVFRILVSILVGTSLVSQNIADARTLDHIRLQAKMHDTTGQLYNVYLFSDDEISEVNLGDVIYSGHYQIAIGSVYEQYMHIQPNNVVVSAGDNLRFNSNRVMNYVVAREYMQQPDVLFVSQFADASHNYTAAYYIRDGVIQRLNWIDKDGKVRNSALNSAIGKANVAGFNLYHTKWWEKSMTKERQGGYHNIEWQLDTSTNSFRYIKEKVLSPMYMLGNGGAGKINKKSSIAEIDKVVTETYGGRIEQVYEMIGEGQKGNVVNAYINNENQPSLKFVLDGNGQVYRRTVFSPDFQTAEGIHVGSTWGEVRRVYPQAKFAGEEGLFIIIPEVRLSCSVKINTKMNVLKVLNGQEVAPDDVEIVGITFY